MKGLIDKYKSKMKMLYGCDIDIIIDDNDVILKKVRNYNDSKFIVPKFVTIVGQESFSHSDYLEELEMGENTRLIENNAFSFGDELKRIDLKNVTDLGNYAFAWCTKLESIKMNNVRNIGKRAFYNCTRIKSIEGNSVEAIGEQAFYTCENLSSVKFNSVKEIGKYCFSNCEDLKNVELSDNISTIECGVFQYCTELKTIDCKNIKEIREHAFDESGVTGDLLCDGIEKIGESSFSGCSNIERIKIPGSIKVIYLSAFAYCENLKYIEICEGVESIEDGAFSCCDNIDKIILPNNIKINRGAFGKRYIKSMFENEYNIENVGNCMIFSRK